MGQTLTDTSPKMYRWQINIWKDGPYHVSSGTCELKQDTSTHLLEWPKSRALTMSSIDKDMEQQEFSYIAVGNAKWYSHFEDSLAVFYKTKHSLTIWFSNSTPGDLHKGAENFCPHKTLYKVVYSSRRGELLETESANGEWLSPSGPCNKVSIKKNSFLLLVFGELPCLGKQDTSTCHQAGPQVPLRTETPSCGTLLNVLLPLASDSYSLSYPLINW